jgi:putative intracellular protease/amidase
MAPKILTVLTSVDKIESINRPTGWYLPEFAHPYEVLSPNASIDVASPKGGVTPIDPSSIEASKSDPSSTFFLNNRQAVWSKTIALTPSFVSTAASEYDALFFPGGHGPMFDLAKDKNSIALVEAFYAAGKPIAAVCHGPAALFAAKKDGGEKSVLDGKRVTGFSNTEEEQVKMKDAMPFSLEDELVKAGGKYEKAEEAWGEKVITDGLIITGQNPASARGVGEAIAKALGI